MVIEVVEITIGDGGFSYECFCFVVFVLALFPCGDAVFHFGQ